MDIYLNIFDSFPSIEKLVKNDNINLEINDIIYNLNKLIDTKETIKLERISNIINFKLFNNKNEPFGANIFKIGKFKDLFSLDGKSYILWLEFKRNSFNKNDEDNFIFYTSIRLKMKFTPINSINSLIIEKSNKGNNIKTMRNKINISKNNNITKNNYLIEENDHFNIDTNNIYYLSSSNFFKKKYEKELYFNTTDENLRENTINNILKDNKNIKRLENIKEKDIKNDSRNYKSKIRTSKKKISSKTFNNINPVLTDNDPYMNHSYKISQKINKSITNKNYLPNNNKQNAKNNKNNKTLNKISYKLVDINEIKRPKNINKSINNFNKTCDNNTSTTIINNQNNIKQNIIVNLNGSYNKNNKNLKNNNAKENEIKLKEKNHYYNERNNKIFNVPKTLNILNNNFINDNYNNRYENNNKDINDLEMKRFNYKTNIKDKQISEDKNKNSINDSHEKNQLLKNMNNTNNSFKEDEINFNNIIYDNEDIDNYYLNIINLKEDETLKEFNSIRKNFELFYSKSFINNIKNDLIKFEFNLSLEKIFELFICYNSEVEYLFYKNIILRNILKDLETKIKCILKKDNKLNIKKKELKLKQNKLLFLEESEFYFIEDLKLQKIMQKKLLENLIKNKTNKKQRFISIFKEIFKKNINYFNIKNIKEKNNSYKNKTERSILSKEFQKMNNKSNQRLYNEYNNYNYNTSYSNKNCHKMKTPKIKKDMKNYQINYLTTNRVSDSKYYNIFSPNKSINKNNTNKINGSYCIAYGNNINSPSKYKIFK